MFRFVSSLLCLLNKYVCVFASEFVYVCVCMCMKVCVSAHVYMFMTFRTYMLSSVVKDAATFELEFCGHEQIKAQTNVRPHCVLLNFEHTKNWNPSKM